MRDLPLPGRQPRGRRLPLEKLADPAPCQDQIDKVVENQGKAKYCKQQRSLLLRREHLVLALRVRELGSEAGWRGDANRPRVG